MPARHALVYLCDKRIGKHLLLKFRRHFFDVYRRKSIKVQAVQNKLSAGCPKWQNQPMLRFKVLLRHSS
jgi:hypothetical protein